MKITRGIVEVGVEVIDEESEKKGKILTVLIIGLLVLSGFVFGRYSLI